MVADLPCEMTSLRSEICCHSFESARGSSAHLLTPRGFSCAAVLGHGAQASKPVSRGSNGLRRAIARARLSTGTSVGPPAERSWEAASLVLSLSSCGREHARRQSVASSAIRRIPLREIVSPISERTPTWPDDDDRVLKYIGQVMRPSSQGSRLTISEESLVANAEAGRNGRTLPLGLAVPGCLSL